jgi:hypothetical protein
LVAGPPLSWGRDQLFVRLRSLRFFVVNSVPSVPSVRTQETSRLIGSTD